MRNKREATKKGTPHPGDTSTRPRGRPGRAFEKRWRPAFLADLAEHGVVSYACAAANITRKTAYEARQRDTDFAQAWADAEDAALDKVEKRVLEAASNPDDDKFNPILAKFVLVARRPDKWTPVSRREVTGPKGGPVEIDNTISLGERLARRVIGLGGRKDDPPGAVGTDGAGATGA